MKNSNNPPENKETQQFLFVAQEVNQLRYRLPPKN
jgi:hypothetical protein